MKGQNGVSSHYPADVKFRMKKNYLKIQAI